jgi:hypothetical protein
MTDKPQLLAALHEATHRVPGVPDHRDHPAGHQGRDHDTHHHGRPAHHGSGRPPRVLVAWQRRIAALFGQEVR